MIPLDLPKTGSLENNLIFGRTPLGLGFSSPFAFQKFKNKIKKKKKKPHIFREKVFFTRPESCTGRCPH